MTRSQIASTLGQQRALLVQHPRHQRQPVSPAVQRLHQPKKRFPPGMTDRGGGKLFVDEENARHS